MKRQSITVPAIPQMHDVDAVAQRLGVSSKTVRRLISRGELPVHRFGKLLRISDEYLLNPAEGQIRRPGPRELPGKRRYRVVLRCR